MLNLMLRQIANFQVADFLHTGSSVAHECQQSAIAGFYDCGETSGM
jgi:hypothetical protein